MAEQESSNNILIIAAEASSELYGTRIIEEAKSRGLSWQFFGIGSRAMESQGCEIVERSEKMAVVGLAEVIRHWSVIKNAFYNLLGKAKQKKPRLAFLMDYPDFNLRLAKRLKNMNIPVVYFISPQVWAWRQGRVHFIKRIINKMLVVFPFEKTFYQKHGVGVEFVGHPLLDELEKNKLTENRRREIRGQYGFSQNDFVIGLLPGSRHSELRYMLQTQIQVAQKLKKDRPQAKFVLLVAPTLEISEIQKLLPQHSDLDLRLVKDEPFKVIQLCDACLVASGTATLVTALAQVPLVIMYKVNTLTGWLAPLLVRGQTYFGMPNLILGKAAVPELFQAKASPENLSAELTRYIDDRQYYERVKSDLSEVSKQLGQGGAIKRVVDELERMMK